MSEQMGLLISCNMGPAERCRLAVPRSSAEVPPPVVIHPLRRANTLNLVWGDLLLLNRACFVKILCSLRRFQQSLLCLGNSHHRWNDRLIDVAGQYNRSSAEVPPPVVIPPLRRANTPNQVWGDLLFLNRA